MVIADEEVSLSKMKKHTTALFSLCPCQKTAAELEAKQMARGWGWRRGLGRAVAGNCYQIGHQWPISVYTCSAYYFCAYVSLREVTVFPTDLIQ